MTDDTTPAQDRLRALSCQNRLLLAQVEALRAKLAEREDEIVRLSAQLIDRQEREVAPPARRGLLARFGIGRG